MGADGQERVAGMESRLWQMLMERATLLCSCCVESFEGSETLVPRKRTPGEPPLWGLLCHSPLTDSSLSLCIRCGQSRTVFQIAFIVGSLEVLMTKILS